MSLKAEVYKAISTYYADEIPVESVVYALASIIKDLTETTPLTDGNEAVSVVETVVESPEITATQAAVVEQDAQQLDTVDPDDYYKMTMIKEGLDIPGSFRKKVKKGKETQEMASPMEDGDLF